MIPIILLFESIIQCPQYLKYQTTSILFFISQPRSHFIPPVSWAPAPVRTAPCTFFRYKPYQLIAYELLLSGALFCLFVFLFICWGRVNTASGSLKFEIILSRPPQWWCYRHEPLCMASRTSLTARSFHCGVSTIYISFLNMCYDWKLREVKIGINNKCKRELRKFHNLIIMMSAQLHPCTKVVLCTLNGWIVWHVNCTPIKLFIKKKVGSCHFDGIMHHSSPESFQHSAPALDELENQISKT